MDNGLLKIGELSRRTGAPVATIKFYLKEGLLPRPTKTKRNVAFYDPACITRIRAIRELQKKRYLPLKIIKRIVRADGDATIQELKTIANMRGRLFKTMSTPVRMKALGAAQLAKRTGISRGDLDMLELHGFIQPHDGLYGEDDMIIIEAAAAFRKAGFSKKLGFEVGDLEFLKKLAESAADEEIALFSKNLIGKVSGPELSKYGREGIQLINSLFAVLTTKHLKNTLSRITAEEA